MKYKWRELKLVPLFSGNSMWSRKRRQLREKLQVY
jgi:hypothetical protein